MTLAPLTLVRMEERALLMVVPTRVRVKEVLQVQIVNPPPNAIMMICVMIWVWQIRWAGGINMTGIRCPRPGIKSPPALLLIVMVSQNVHLQIYGIKNGTAAAP